MKKVTEIDTTKTYSGLPAPAFWRVVERREDGIMWERLAGERITVIESTCVKDNQTWLHVSVAKPSRHRMPSYEDIQAARKLFIGEQRECYQIFPPQERYVNIGPVLHLFCCLDQPKGILPHFEGVTSFGIMSV